jgi:hypothetical protein
MAEDVEFDTDVFQVIPDSLDCWFSVRGYPLYAEALGGVLTDV